MLRASGAEAIGVPTDVSDAAQVEALAQATLDTFGAVHLLFNNAGVGAGGFVWESTRERLAWVFGVNVMGVAHGVRAFTPIMLAQNEAGAYRQYGVGRGAAVAARDGRLQRVEACGRRR